MIPLVSGEAIEDLLNEPGTLTDLLLRIGGGGLYDAEFIILDTPVLLAVLSILVIFLFGGLLTAVLYWMYPEMTFNLPVWRSALALLLIFDIFAGCIANFTVSARYPAAYVDHFSFIYDKSII